MGQCQESISSCNGILFFFCLMAQEQLCWRCCFYVMWAKVLSVVLSMFESSYVSCTSLLKIRILQVLTKTCVDPGFPLQYCCFKMMMISNKSIFLFTECKSEKIECIQNQQSCFFGIREISGQAHLFVLHRKTNLISITPFLSQNIMWVGKL